MTIIKYLITILIIITVGYFGWEYYTYDLKPGKIDRGLDDISIENNGLKITLDHVTERTARGKFSIIIKKEPEQFSKLYLVVSSVDLHNDKEVLKNEPIFREFPEDIAEVEISTEGIPSGNYFVGVVAESPEMTRYPWVAVASTQIIIN